MIHLRLDLDLSAADRLVGEARRQVPFAISVALNETAKLAQLRAQRSLDTQFTIAPSRREFFRRMIKIPPGGFATKRKLAVDLGVYGPRNAEGRHDVLLRHAAGGTFTRPGSLAPFFIPAHVLRPGAYDLPPKFLYPGNLGLQPVRTIEGGTTIRGRVRTSRTGSPLVSNTRGQAGRKAGTKGGRVFFTVPLDNPKGRTPGIYERTGTDRGDVQLLWLYREKIAVKPRLTFEVDVRTVFAQRFGVEFQRALGRALATARR